jgi:hypothetical protein
MKKGMIFLGACFLYFSANAYRIEWGRAVTISQPVYEDLYIAGGTVTLNAPVYGDLIVAGGTIYINDTVMNDLLLAGGTVHINGYVADDIRCAGGRLHIMKNIGGDLVITGGQVDIASDVVINGGLITSGGKIVANGTIRGIVKSAAGDFTFNGIANSDFDSRSQRLAMNGTVLGKSVLAATDIIIGDKASFGNDVRYWNKKGNLDFKQSLKNGSAVYDESLKVKPSNWYYLGHATIIGLIWYLSTVLLFLILIQYLFRNIFKRAGDNVSHGLGKSLGLGFLFFIGVPVSILLLLLTIIGIPVGLIVMFTYIILLLLATVITSLVIANWYNHRFSCNWSYWQIVFSSMAMFILFKLVTFTPFLGWFIMLVLACIAFGAILRNINWRRKQQVVLQ